MPNRWGHSQRGHKDAEENRGTTTAPAQSPLPFNTQASEGHGFWSLGTFCSFDLQRELLGQQKQHRPSKPLEWTQK